jgi:protein-tyrosine-phosphatase
MKWVTREKARVDRIACPWLISRFIDREPEFLFVPAADVMDVARREGATPYDVPGVELGHHGDRCSFDAFLETYRLDDPALRALAVIVRGADTDARDLAPEAPGLYALASGFREIAHDDHDNMARQFPAYDALYAYCRGRAERPVAEPRVLFVCLHGAAKSVLAAARFERLAARRGLRATADFAGTEPDPEIAPRVVKELAAEGVDLRGRRPRPVTAADVATATRIVSFGCDLATLGPRAPVDRWDDVPAVSDGYETARDAIDRRLARLVDELART